MESFSFAVALPKTSGQSGGSPIDVNASVRQHSTKKGLRADPTGSQSLHFENPE
jgi:hypothetical protein